MKQGSNKTSVRKVRIAVKRKVMILSIPSSEHMQEKINPNEAICEPGQPAKAKIVLTKNRASCVRTKCQ